MLEARRQLSIVARRAADETVVICSLVQQTRPGTPLRSAVPLKRPLPLRFIGLQSSSHEHGLPLTRFRGWVT